MAYGSAYLITIDHTKCGSASSSNFPVLVKMTGVTSLKTVGNGGVINSTGTQTGGAAGTTIPYDLVFSSDVAGSSKYPWEVEYYDGATGDLWAWVKIPTVSNSTDTNFYVVYGDSGVTTQQNTSSFSPSNVWDTNHKSVWHFASNVAGSVTALGDSTSSANTLTTPAGGITTAVGQIDGGISNASNLYCQGNDTGFAAGSADRTIELWFNTPTSQGSSNMTLISYGTGNMLSVLMRPAGIIISPYTASDVTVSYTWTTNTWTHLVITISSNTGQLYINGAAQGSTWSASGFGTTLNGVCRIGEIQIFSGVYYVGKLDEVRVSNSARSADWVLTAYNNQNAPGNVGSPGFLTFAPPIGNILASDTITLSDAILTDNPHVADVSDTLSLSDAAANNVTGAISGDISGYDVIRILDSVLTSFEVAVPVHRGNIDYDQVRVAARSGDGPKFLMLKGSFTAGNVIVFDADGNAVDSGHT